MPWPPGQVTPHPSDTLSTKHPPPTGQKSACGPPTPEDNFWNSPCLGMSVWFEGPSGSSDIDQPERIVRQASCVADGTCYVIAGTKRPRPRKLRFGLKTSFFTRSFARGLAASDFSSWLPSHRGQCHQRTLRNNHKLNVLSSRTKRFNRSPIANIVSLLNSTN